MGSIDDYPEISSLLFELHKSKNVAYQDSWKKRGHLGIFFNVARKFDRIEKLADLVEAKGLEHALQQVDASILDSLADLANYCILWLCFFREHSPEMWKKWQNHVETVADINSKSNAWTEEDEKRWAESRERARRQVWEQARQVRE